MSNYELTLQGLRFNYALQAVTQETIELLIELARQQDVEGWRERMFRGEKINQTENRAALHVALRAKQGTPFMLDGRDITQDVKAVHDRMAKAVGDIREGRWKGHTGKPIRHIVNIGIGGSDLGPRLAVRALQGFASGPELHFVANADAFDLLSTLKKLDPEETLFIVVSKTFTTQETLLNARTARQWLTDKMGETCVPQHFIAVSANTAEVEKFGVAADHTFTIWDWVGGRYSLWSAVGISIALAVGIDNFDKLREGAAAMDDHFRTAPLAQNMPVILAMLGIWQRNFNNTSAQAILPYSDRLRDLPFYLQQLEMESNGKSVTRDGQAVDYATAPIIFGECGTTGQHSFYQCLHQGSDKIPADFIGVIEDDLHQPDHHRALLISMVAQAGAFAFGQTQVDLPQNIYAGNRSSNLLILDRLDPYTLGLLLALYEHKTFVQGIVWNINSFDQPGVELGKKMARRLDAKSHSQNSEQGFLADFYSHILSTSKK